MIWELAMWTGFGWLTYASLVTCGQWLHSHVWQLVSCCLEQWGYIVGAHQKIKTSLVV